MPDPKADDNVATEDNVELAEQLIASPGTEKPKYIAVGKTETPPVVGNTALGEEVRRKEATIRTASGKVLTMAVVFAATEATGAIKVAEIFAASTSGSMYARLASEVINVGAGDSLEIKWTLEHTR
jgi:hypothetical protein